MPNPDRDPKPNHNPTVTLSLKPDFESQKCLQTRGDWDLGANKGCWFPQV